MTAQGSQKHTFTLGKDDFLLDCKPFQIRSGELHPERIPRPYWRHRVQMAKAFGLNTIALYTFWNAHEVQEGKFDYSTDRLNLAEFLKICQDEKMWVIFRPGPYCCGEWDFGGIPPYLLKYPDLKIRSMDPRYIKASDRYLTRVSKVVKPFFITNGGPVILLQIENEYGSYGNDHVYMTYLRDKWRSLGVDVPFYTSDGPTPGMLEAGTVEGGAIGLDSGSSEADFELAKRMRPGVPVMSGETYPGWLTHWGEKWAVSPIESNVKELDWLMSSNKSFNLYVFHGGTNFGLTAGANSGGKGYEPDVTSYDYDAPVDEQGRATPKYMQMREVMQKHSPVPLPAIPAPIPTMAFPEVSLSFTGSVWASKAKAVPSTSPRTFEELGQNQGIMIYETMLRGERSGALRIPGLHDYAIVVVDGKEIGVLDRRLGQNEIKIPHGNRLQIMVEGMGHINYGSQMIDRKGIVGDVLLNGRILFNWTIRPHDLNSKASLAEVAGQNHPLETAKYYSGTLTFDETKDTFIDCSKLGKGYVWVNGNLLGRYWSIGPQQRLYCPAQFLKANQRNEVRILELQAISQPVISGKPTLKE